MKSSSTLLRRRLDLARVGDDEVHLVLEPVALERGAQLRVELVAGHVGPQRDVQVVRPQLDALAAARTRTMNVLPPLKRPISTNGPLLRVAREPVEQRRLVDLQRRDAVVELVRREEEREILEAAHVGRPLLDVREPHRRRVAQHGRRGSGSCRRRCGRERRTSCLTRAAHGGERYCNARTYAQASAARRPPEREHGDVRGEADGRGGDRPDDQPRQPERDERASAADDGGDERRRAASRPQRAETQQEHGEHERAS